MYQTSASFQFLALPFAITHEAVTNIYEEKLPGTETPAWYGSVDSHDWGLWTDYAFLLLFGGIPWQCYYQVSRQHLKHHHLLDIITNRLIDLILVPN